MGDIGEHGLGTDQTGLLLQSQNRVIEMMPRLVFAAMDLRAPAALPVALAVAFGSHAAEARAFR
jgi:hypothetical protein